MDSPDSSRFATKAAEVLGRLRSASVRARRFLVLRGGVRLAAGAVLAVFATLGLDVWLRPGLPVRGAIALIALAGLAALCWRFVIGPARIRLRPLDVAAVWDRARPRSGDRLVQAVATLTASAPAGELSAIARERACSELGATDFDALLDRVAARRRMGMLALLLAIPILGAAIAPATAGIWARRWLLASNEPWPQDTWLEIENLREGRLVVPAREPFTLRTSVRDGSVVPDRIELQYEIDGAERRVVAMTRAEANLFTADVPAVRADGRLWLRGGDDRVGPVAVVPRERPEIEGFEIQSVAPGATAAVSRRFAMQEDDLRFLEGTGLTLDLQANEDLAGVVVGGADGAGLRADPRGPRAFRIGWMHDRLIAFSVEVESAETHLRSHPRNLAIGVFRDTVPRVQLECSGIGDRVTAFARVPCRVDALDDLGIASARIAITTQTDANDSAPARSIEEPVPLGDQAGTLHLVAERALELGELGLQPGRHVRVVAFAKDGRHPEPQEGASRARILTIVPPEVLLAEIVLRLQAARSRLRATLAEERELRDLMLAPLEPDAVGALSKRFRVAERTLWSVRRAVEDGVREMALNRVLEDEGVALLQSTVTEPFSSLERGLLKEQREAIESGLAEGLPKAGIEAAHARQLRIIAELESILRGMDRWDTLVDLIAQLGEVIRLQTDARKNTQGAGVESRDTPRDK